MIEAPRSKLSSLKPTHGTHNRSAAAKRFKPTNSDAKVLGKLCPSCGIAGSIFCETPTRIIYECGNGHQYETKKRLPDVKAD